ncbi:MAG: tyrosine-type recombinase/integrase [Rubripirellula sp.]
MRHSFGTHLSRAGVAPRVAQAAMRHSDIDLTMNTYTDASLLDTNEAIESLPIVRDQKELAPMLAPNPGKTGQMESHPDHLADDGGDDTETKKARKTLGFTSFDAVGATRFELATSTSRT